MSNLLTEKELDRLSYLMRDAGDKERFVYELRQMLANKSVVDQDAENAVRAMQEMDDYVYSLENKYLGDE